jgi:hypothetical protein
MQNKLLEDSTALETLMAVVRSLTNQRQRENPAVRAFAASVRDLQGSD